MAQSPKPIDWRFIMLVGVADVVLGVALALAGLEGWFGPGTEALLPVGALIAVAGVGVALWARAKHAAASRSGSLN